MNANPRGARLCLIMRLRRAGARHRSRPHAYASGESNSSASGSQRFASVGRQAHCTAPDDPNRVGGAATYAPSPSATRSSEDGAQPSLRISSGNFTEAPGNTKNCIRRSGVSVTGPSVNSMRSMRANGGGRIVNVASRAAWRGETEFADYGASKAALVNLTRSIARGCASSI